MSSLFQPNPFWFLLYTEWVMLASCASLAVVEGVQKQSIPMQHILILAVLGLMGLKLPNGKHRIKVAYTVIAIGLIFFGTTLGYLHILPTLYLIVVIRGCFLFDLAGRLAIAGISFLLFLINQFQYLQNITLVVPQDQQQHFWMHQLAEILMFALGLFLVMQLASTLLAERRTREQLATAHEKLRQYALQVEDLTAVQERNRIARDIHDSLGHALTALNVQLQTAVRLWPVNTSQAQSFLAQAQKLGEIAIKEVRQSVSTLRVDARKEEPLEEAIASLVEDFRCSTGIWTSVGINLHKQVPPRVVNTIYRISQEALTNICKHAQATAVMIQISTNLNSVCLIIEDNGKGFKMEQNSAGFGIQGMRERVTALNGSFQLKAQPEAGCQIIVMIPFCPAATQAEKGQEKVSSLSDRYV